MTAAADDAYAVLGVAPSASDAEIRAAYLRLARRDGTGDVVRIQHIVRAYEALRSAEARQAYDEQRQQQDARRMRPTRIADTIDLDAFEANDAPPTHFTYPCRCGQSYILTLAQVAQGQHDIACTGCSETVHVVWDD